jgi:hypothetical protein
MSMAPDHDLIKACMDAMKADPEIAAKAGNRVYDRPLDKPAAQLGIASPYISLGPTSNLPASVGDCVDGVEITLQWDVWSWGAGEAYSTVECRTIVERIRRVLDDAELALTDNALVTLTYELSSVVRDRDGITTHGLIQFTGIVETP